VIEDLDVDTTIGSSVGATGRGDERRRPAAVLRRVRPRRRTAFSVAAAVSVLTGCGLFGDSSSDRVVILGDSITNASQGELLERFADRDGDLTVDATPGYTAEEVLVQASAVVDELGDDEAEQVIVNVGTNDMFSGYDPARTRDDVVAIVDLFPNARCVHVVTISERIFNFEIPDLPDRIVELNGLLEDLAGERSQVRILDWNEVLDDPPGDLETSDLLRSDTVHTSPEGEQVLADAYLEALDDCA
jgi:lysophospholipase L1-like esterase